MVESDETRKRTEVRSSESGIVRKESKRIRGPMKEGRAKSIPNVIDLDGPECDELVKSLDAPTEKAREGTSAQMRPVEEEEAQEVEQIFDFERGSAVSRHQQQIVES